MKKIIVSQVLLAALTLCARTYYISPDAQTGGDGSKEKPFAKIQQGLDNAKPGDTVELAPGIYYERVKFVRSGDYLKPIRLNGPRTAIIDGTVEFTQNWKKAPQYGPKAWCAKVPDIFFPNTVRNPGSGLVIDPDGLIIQLFEKRVKDINNSQNDKRTTWYAPELMSKGIGRTGFNFIKALAMYRPKTRDVIVAYGDGRDVSKANLKFTPPIPSVTISGVNRCVVSGITIRHAWMGVFIENSLGSTVEDCRIMRSDRGVELASGSDRCIVRFCDISMDPIFRCNPSLKGGWDAAWPGHKRGGYWDRIGINIRQSIGGHQIHDNYIHNHWGGIQDYGDPEQNLLLNVHHNRIDEIEDDGLEPNGSGKYCLWHHNYVTRSRCGFRIKCINQGPIFAFGNVFFNNHEDFRNFVGSNYPKTFFLAYHNTSITRAAINNNKVKMPPGSPNYCFFNNIFVCDAIYGGTHAVNWRDAGNVYIRRTDTPQWDNSIANAKKHGFKSTSRFLKDAKPEIADAANGNFEISAASPARNAGVDLKKYNLPGVDEFYGSTNDCGAVPYGSKMFKTARRPTEVSHVAAGAWPKPEDKLVLPSGIGTGLITR